MALILICLLFFTTILLTIIKIVTKEKYTISKILSIINLLIAILFVGYILLEARVEIDIEDFVHQLNFKIMSTSYILTSIILVILNFKNLKQ